MTPAGDATARLTDDETVTVHLDRTVARHILRTRLWREQARGGWESPEGRHYWHTDEALAVALTRMGAKR